MWDLSALGKVKKGNVMMYTQFFFFFFQKQRPQDRGFQSVVTVAQKKYRSTLWSVHRCSDKSVL